VTTGYVAASASRTHAVLLREDGHAVSWGHGQAGRWSKPVQEMVPRMWFKGEYFWDAPQAAVAMNQTHQVNVMSLSFLMECAM